MIFGDGEIHNADADWRVTRVTEQQEDGTILYKHIHTHMTYAEAASSLQGADFLYGGAGNDWIFAHGGDDVVYAGADDDVVMGEAGNDILLGEAGNDTLAGDGGRIAGSLHGNN